MTASGGRRSGRTPPPLVRQHRASPEVRKSRSGWHGRATSLAGYPVDRQVGSPQQATSLSLTTLSRCEPVSGRKSWVTGPLFPYRRRLSPTLRQRLHVVTKW